MPPNPGEARTIIQSHVDFDDLIKHAHGNEDVAAWQLLPELPTSHEIMNPHNSIAELLPFPVKHRWESKREYLETLYKILRVEGTENLRGSVNTFKATPNMNDDDNTCVYTKVHVKGYLFAKMGTIARVSFSTYRAGAKIKWKQSQRLMPGKIVALSTDNFHTDCRVAVVAQRPFQGGLDQNPPLVDIIWADPDKAVIDPDQDLVMIESRSGYYEAVRHALRGLQHAMQEWSPIDRYTVLRDRRDLACSSAPKKFNLGPIVSHLTPNQVKESQGDQHIQQRMFQELNERFNDCKLGEFHKVKPYTSLDDSQLEALERVISKELAIIQGPPGTGKTFTSIQSLKTILANRKPGDPPLVVAAQTNHALDQLLSHLIACNVNVMRVGGRTDNEKILERNVYQLRMKTGKLPGQGKMGAAERDRGKLVEEFEAVVNGTFGGEGLLATDMLLKSGIITEAQYKSLECDDEWVSGEGISSMEIWLGEEKIERNRQVVDELDFAEVEAVDEIFELDANLDDDQPADDDDEDRIYGEFVPLTSQHTGRTPLMPHWEERCRGMLDNDRLFDIPRGYRGGVYRILQSKLLDVSASQFREIIKKTTKVAQRRKAARWTGDLHVVDKHRIDVVGCTTTGLTKYRGFLFALQPRILLVEEAAETREANIASAMFPSLQQLILVGDHQQLPPSCDVKQLGVEPYNLNVSLFERLVENNLPYTMLNQQRRMAPELREIVQQFYPALRDHPLVTNTDKRPLIPGMGERRSWFFNHRWPEETDADNSKFNSEEARMVVAFIIYLLRNGVSAGEITILTYYKGQRRKILQRLRDSDVPIGSSFKVATVDSYQGEENEIVLLSLVRSPQLGRGANVGFLDSRNRATVAVSRAKRGFFVFGNKQNLLTASLDSFTTWGPVWNGFAENKRVSTAKGLPLVCQKHKNEIWVKEPNDLVNNAGGCNLKCGEIRDCGHACALPCHYWPHDKLPCRAPCTKDLACGHDCGGACSDPCSCSQNCPDSCHLQLHQQLSTLALNGVLSSQEQESTAELSSGTSPRPHGGNKIRSHQSSPERWQQFSHNVHVHDDRIRNTILQRDGIFVPQEVRETYVRVSTGDGYRLVPINHEASRPAHRAPTEAQLAQREASFQRTAIGYEEHQEFSRRRRQQRANEMHRQPSASAQPHGNMQQSSGNLGVRSTRNMLAHTGHAPAGAAQVSVFGGDGSVVDHTGYEVEVLGRQPIPLVPSSLTRRAQISTKDTVEPLIEFDAEADAVASPFSARPEPAAEDPQNADEENSYLITF